MMTTMMMTIAMPAIPQLRPEYYHRMPVVAPAATVVVLLLLLIGICSHLTQL
jgi:hypothetical protein